MDNECYYKKIDKSLTDIEKDSQRVYRIGFINLCFWMFFFEVSLFIVIFNLYPDFTEKIWIGLAILIAVAFFVYVISSSILNEIMKPDIDDSYKRLSDSYSKLIAPKAGKEQILKFIKYQIKYIENNSIEYGHGAVFLDSMFKIGPRNLFKLNLTPLESTDIEERYSDIFAA